MKAFFWRHRIVKRHLLPLLLGLWVCPMLLAAPTAWKTVAPGLEYAQIGNFTGFPNGYIHAFRIDLNYYQLSIGFTQQGNEANLSLPQLMHQQNAILATNGGFFAPGYKPLGLRISQGQGLSPLKLISWWGVFEVSTQGHAQIVSQKNYRPDNNRGFAIQAGPRLLENGAIPRLKLDIDYRTALGITKTGRVILLATDNLMLSTMDLATTMQRPEAAGGLGCVDAINLDGGHSTQMYTQLVDFSVQVPSYTPVADAVLVLRK
jgi:uncharacterized protein YigE (DUF2233 family)